MKKVGEKALLHSTKFCDCLANVIFLPTWSVVFLLCSLRTKLKFLSSASKRVNMVINKLGELKD